MKKVEKGKKDSLNSEVLLMPSFSTEGESEA